MKLASTSGLFTFLFAASFQSGLGAPLEDYDLAFISFDLDLSNDAELSTTYEMSSQTHMTALFEKDCSTSITDLTITPSETLTPINSTHDRLELAYNIDTPNLEASRVWNTESSTIELCLVVQLWSGQLIMAEDIRRMDYTLDLDVDVIVDEGSGLIAMGMQTSILTSGSGNLAYAVETCKCNGLDFVCDTDPVEPNTDLHLCYKSVSSDVEIENIDFMVAYQGQNAMVMIAPTYTIFTTVTNVPSQNGILVTTRLPLNMFTYAVNETVRVEGSLHMKLVEPTRRRLLSVSPESWSRIDDEEGFDETPVLSMDVDDGEGLDETHSLLPVDEEGFDETPMPSMDLDEGEGLDETHSLLPVDEEEPLLPADEKPSLATTTHEVTVKLQLEPKDISSGVTRSGRIVMSMLTVLCITLFC